MLVLTRKPGESIVIDIDIVIAVVEIRGGQVRVGIQAPRQCKCPARRSSNRCGRRTSRPPPPKPPRTSCGTGR
jgi:hypothetical protein